jgi:hypothetical protein
MEATEEFDEFKKEIQNYFDNTFTKEIFEEEYKEFILLDTSTGKYHVLDGTGGYLKKTGNEGNYFFKMLVNKLETLNKEHHNLNWCGVKTIGYCDPLRIIRSR